MKHINEKLFSISNEDAHKVITILGFKLKFKTREKQITSEPDKYVYPLLAEETFNKLVNDFEFETVLDLGCGVGYHSKLFEEHNKKVVSLDYGKSVGFLLNENKDGVILADFMKYDFAGRQFDAVWCAHVLEHQVNPNLFLKKVHTLIKEDGILAITVPPLKENIVGGHVSLWNAGILLYQLLLAGFDCKNAKIKSYGYNISIILRKKTIDLSDKIVFGAGDINTIKPFLPDCIQFLPGTKDLTFNGNIESINWD